jgi:IclR family acetate operon transcriptional repressor
MSDERYRVQSLGRAFDALDLILAAGTAGARLTDLAKGIGISKAAAYAILQTLKARGLVADFGEGLLRRYRLGTALIQLGERALANISLVDIALPVLRDATEALNLTSRVAVLDDGFAVVVGRVDAPGAIRFEAALGRRELPHCSAIGKALLATLTRDDATAILRRLGQPRRTAKSLVTIDSLSEDLDRISRRGYAVDDEEDTDGVVCVAACVFDRAAQAIGAISVTGLKQHLSRSRVQHLSRDVIRYADRISAELGGLPGSEALGRRLV